MSKHTPRISFEPETPRDFTFFNDSDVCYRSLEMLFGAVNTCLVSYPSWLFQQFDKPSKKRCPLNITLLVLITNHSLGYQDLDGVLKEHCGPKLSGNFLSRLTFWPATTIVRAGAKKPIEKDQLFRLAQENRTPTVWKRFKKNWKLETAEKGCVKSSFFPLVALFFARKSQPLRRLGFPCFALFGEPSWANG
jgi:hypothetical protein